MPTNHFKKWADYFYQCYHDVELQQGLDSKFPGYWKYFMMSNLVFMASRRKVGADKASFVRSLQDAPTLMEKVKAFRSDTKVCEFAKQIASHLYNDDVHVPKKSKQMALLSSKAGDKFFEEGDFISALDSYNSSMLQVPPEETELLIELYRKRAQVLVQLEQISDALMDIDSIVLHDNVSKETSLEVLESAIGVCNEKGLLELVSPLQDLLEMVREGDEYRKAPRTKRNPIPHDLTKFNGTSLDGATDAVKIDMKQGKGRCVVADRDIEVGEPLIMETAFVTRVHTGSRHEYCFNCADILNSRFEPCLGCDEVSYCSQFCRDESWKNVHKEECGYVETMEYLTSGYDALRAILTGGLEKALTGFRNPKPLDHWTKNKLRTNYDGYVSLMDHYRRLTDQQLISFLFQATLTAEFLILLKGTPVETDIVELSTIVLSNMIKNKINTWAIYDSVHKQCGSAVFVSFSMPNHSCEPNSHQVYYGNTMVSSAVRPIHKGEEITMSYGPVVGQMDVIDRQNKLRDVYDFECDCNGCMRDLSRYSSLNFDLTPPDLQTLMLQRKGYTVTNQNLQQEYTAVESSSINRQPPRPVMTATRRIPTQRRPNEAQALHVHGMAQIPLEDLPIDMLEGDEEMESSEYSEKTISAPLQIPRYRTRSTYK